MRMLDIFPVGGVGDVAWPSPGAPVHRVRLRGEVGHSASNTGAGGAVGLALVGGARLRPPRPAAGAQGRVVAETGPSLGIIITFRYLDIGTLQTSPSLLHGCLMSVYVQGVSKKRVT